jgi:transcriptional regulator NrdR family protein
MLCPKCEEGTTFVVDSRAFGEFTVRRRRRCTHCDFRFNTFERLEGEYILFFNIMKSYLAKFGHLIEKMSNEKKLMEDYFGRLDHHVKKIRKEKTVNHLDDSPP